MSDSNIDQEIADMQKAKLDIQDQGHPADYVGVNISKEKDGTYKFTQPSLTDSIIEQAGLGDRAAVKKIPMNAHNLLHHHPYSIDHDEDLFKYRSIIGKLNYLARFHDQISCMMCINAHGSQAVPNKSTPQL